MSVQQNYLTLKQQLSSLPNKVELLVVSKNATQQEIAIWHELGQQHFGENRLEHLQHMANTFADTDIVWHFIGHLQTNKVRKVLQYCDWVQSVDSIKLAHKINTIAEQLNKSINVLIQLNISQEKQKSGIAIDELAEMVATLLTYPNIRLRGLMCMAPRFDDASLTRPIFEKCADLFMQIKQTYQLPATFDTLSMGMSQDYQQAIACGATQIRIGSLLLV